MGLTRSWLRRALGSGLEALLKNTKRRGRLAAADVLIVSHAKSGRTWLTAMLSHLYHQAYGIDERELIRFDNFHKLQPAIPRIYLTHDNQKDERRTALVRPEHIAAKKVILLVRDPRDIAVSAWFQKARNRADAVHDVTSETMFDYVRQKLPQIVAFQRRWDGYRKRLPAVLTMRYEDLRASTVAELARIAEFLEIPVDRPQLQAAVAFASFDALRAKEASGFFRSDRLLPFDPADANSFKVREGRVGGYARHFDAAQLAQIDRLIDDPAVARFGYRPGASGLGIASADRGPARIDAGRGGS
jgi:alcohol sulfotransferase